MTPETSGPDGLCQARFPFLIQNSLPICLILHRSSSSATGPLSVDFPRCPTTFRRCGISQIQIRPARRESEHSECAVIQDEPPPDVQWDLAHAIQVKRSTWGVYS
jgi:hypothetical protein